MKKNTGRKPGVTMDEIANDAVKLGKFRVQAWAPLLVVFFRVLTLVAVISFFADYRSSASFFYVIAALLSELAVWLVKEATRDQLMHPFMLYQAAAPGFLTMNVLLIPLWLTILVMIRTPAAIAKREADAKEERRREEIGVWGRVSEDLFGRGFWRGASEIAKE